MQAMSEHCYRKETQNAAMETRPTFYPSPRLAMQAPPEKLAYVAAFNPNNDGRTDAMTVVDVASGPSH